MPRMAWRMFSSRPRTISYKRCGDPSGFLLTFPAGRNRLRWSIEVHVRSDLSIRPPIGDVPLSLPEDRVSLGHNENLKEREDSNGLRVEAHPAPIHGSGSKDVAHQPHQP